MIKAGDIIFVRGKSPIARLVQWFDGEFNHVAIAMSHDKILEAQGGTRSRITDFYFDDYEVIDLQLTDEERDRVVHLGIELVGKRYDYVQIIGYVLRKIFKINEHKFNSPKNLICSELVYIILKELGKIPPQDNLIDATPNELYRYLKSKFMKSDNKGEVEVC